MAVARSSNAARPGEAAEGFDMGAESRRSGITNTKRRSLDLHRKSLTHLHEPKSRHRPITHVTRLRFDGPNPKEGRMKRRIVLMVAALVASLAVGASA